ncbi:MAG: CPBP family intramembrane metalloprotease [Clostridiales bacterium]|nr:CPBP family intramembrane metalloprotease [Clostridiales bacterium]
MNETLNEKKELKKTVNFMSLSVIFYNLIMIGVIMTQAIIESVKLLKNDPNASEAVFDNLQKEFINSGTSSIIGVGAGLLLLLLIYRNKHVIGEIFSGNKIMTVQSFLCCFCVFMGVQTIFSAGAYGIEHGLNAIGYSVMGDIKEASSSSMTISMFLYASVLAPVAEELVYRGFVMRSLMRYGKVFAIVVSAVVFGAMHGNLVQGLFAAMAGLVLGYVAAEYSIKWSILLHLLNNMVMGDLMSYMIKGFSTSTQTWITNGLMGVFFIIAIVILYRYRSDIKKYLAEFKPEKGYFKYAFTSVFMLIFLGLELLMAVDGITAI